MAHKAESKRTGVVAVVGGQTGLARAAFSGAIRFANLHANWELRTRVWIGLPPLATLDDFRGDGVLYLGPDTYSGAAAPAETLAKLRRSKVPVVYATAPPDGPVLPCVLIDDLAVGRQAARHLLANGLRHFGFFADEDRPYDLALRQKGFTDTVQQAGATIQEYVDNRPWCRTPWPKLQERLAQWIAALPKPVGIGVSSDARAAFVLNVCRKHGLRVPEEVSVVGAGNDLIICECTRPTLSSVELAAARVGYAAAELLQQVLAGAVPPGQPILVPPLDVVGRQSSDYRAIGDPLVADCLTFIREQLPRGVAMPDLLEMSRVSQRTLEMRFRKALGRTPAAEIRRLQVDRAKQLLADTNLSLTQVAAACGFNNQVRFGIVFRRLLGQTPGEYRRRMT